MASMDAFVLLWKERKNCLSVKEQNHIDSIVRTYNKTKICSTYNSAPISYSSLPNVYLFNQGEMSYAG